MQSPLFEQSNLEVQATERFALQNPQMLRVHLGGDVLAVKGAMVAFQGQIRFDHEKAGSVGKLFKKVVTGEDDTAARALYSTFGFENEIEGTDRTRSLFYELNFE